ncbi:MAG: GNAT family N-acetyltransferase [Alphaproteobacteria bacterium]|nr:GNAT family N-acetyltransferase [Alphaproteobacteria bacterium]
MKWDNLRRSDEREIDQFDACDVYHMFAKREGVVVGYQRMLPMTGPNLLSNVYPELCETEIPRHFSVWEWTRYFVEKSHRERGRALSPVAAELLLAIVEWGQTKGVRSIVIEMDPLWLLRLVQLHFRVMPLGLPVRMGEKDVLAVQAHFDHRTLLKLREIRGNSEPVARFMTSRIHADVA